MSHQLLRPSGARCPPLALLQAPQRALPHGPHPLAATAPGVGAAPAAAAATSTIDRYYLSRHCAVCDELTRPTRVLCDACLARPQLAAAVLAARLNRQERQYAQLARVCGHCGGRGGMNTGDGESLGLG